MSLLSPGRLCWLAHLLLIATLLGGCQTRDEAPPVGPATGGYGGITATVVWPAQLGPGLLSQPQTAPAGVTTVVLKVTGADMNPVSASFSASAGGGSVGNVPVGSNRTLAVEGRNATSLIYIGAVTGISVSSGSTSNAGVVTMESVSSQVAPGNVTSLTATAGNQQVTLSWSLAADTASQTTTGVMIRRSGSPFTIPFSGGAPSQGTLVSDGYGTSATVTGLSNGTPVYFALFAHDAVPNYAGGVATSATPIAPGTDVTPPTVGTRVPAPNATNVAVATTIDITFSEAMNQAATQGAFSLAPTSNPSATVSGSFTWLNSGTTLRFTPGSALSGGTSYTVTVTTAATDLAGISLSSGVAYSFTTVSTTCVWDTSTWDNCPLGP